MNLKARILSLGVVAGILAFGATSEANAQFRLPDLGRIGDAVNAQLKVSEVTLESINFRDQTASLSVSLDVANGLIPVSLKDFDYSLRLADQDLIEGHHDGTLKVGGRRAS